MVVVLDRFLKYKEKSRGIYFRSGYFDLERPRSRILVRERPRL